MGLLDDLLGEISTKDLQREREDLAAQVKRLNRKISALDELIALKDGHPELPPLAEAILRVFKDAGPVPLDTDDVMQGLKQNRLLGDRSKSSVNATLGRLAAEGQLERVGRGIYTWEPKGGWPTPEDLDMRPGVASSDEDSSDGPSPGWGEAPPRARPASDDEDIPF